MSMLRIEEGEGYVYYSDSGRSYILEECMAFGLPEKHMSDGTTIRITSDTVVIWTDTRNEEDDVYPEFVNYFQGASCGEEHLLYMCKYLVDEWEAKRFGKEEEKMEKRNYMETQRNVRIRIYDDKSAVIMVSGGNGDELCRINRCNIETCFTKESIGAYAKDVCFTDEGKTLCDWVGDELLNCVPSMLRELKRKSITDLTTKLRDMTGADIDINVDGDTYTISVYAKKRVSYSIVCNGVDECYNTLKNMIEDEGKLCIDLVTGEVM